MKKLLKGYNSEPDIISWTAVVFDLSCLFYLLNAQRVLRYNSEPHKDMYRWKYRIPVMHVKYKETFGVTVSPKAYVRRNKFSYCKDYDIVNDEVSVDDSLNISVKSAKCHLFIVDLKCISNKKIEKMLKIKPK